MNRGKIVFKVIIFVVLTMVVLLNGVFYATESCNIDYDINSPKINTDSSGFPHSYIVENNNKFIRWNGGSDWKWGAHDIGISVSDGKWVIEFDIRYNGNTAFPTSEYYGIWLSDVASKHPYANATGNFNMLSARGDKFFSGGVEIAGLVPKKDRWYSVTTVLDKSGKTAITTITDTYENKTASGEIALNGKKIGGGASSVFKAVAFQAVNGMNTDVDNIKINYAFGIDEFEFVSQTGGLQVVPTSESKYIKIHFQESVDETSIINMIFVNNKAISGELSLNGRIYTAEIETSLVAGDQFKIEVKPGIKAASRDRKFVGYIYEEEVQGTEISQAVAGIDFTTNTIWGDAQYEFLTPGTNVKFEVKDGKQTAVMSQQSQGFNLYLGVNVNSLLPDTSYTAKITVDYYDSGKGYFSIQYYDKNGFNEAEKVTMTDTKMWKSHTFVLDNMVFDKLYMGCDFNLATYTVAYGYSEEPVFISGISIEKLLSNNPITAKVTSNRNGNILRRTDEKKLNLVLENATPYSVLAIADYIIYDQNNKVWTTDSFGKISFYGGEKKTYQLDLSNITEKFGAYRVEVHIKHQYDELGLPDEFYNDYFMNYDYSIVNNPEVSEKNDLMWMAVHRQYRTPWNILQELLESAGIGGIREEILWKDVEVSANQFTRPATDDFMAGAENAGIDSMVIASGVSPIYITDMTMPDTVEELEAFGKYVKWLCETYGDKMQYCEIWNEPNVKYSSTQYVELLKTAYAAVQGVNAEKGYSVKTAGMVTSLMPWKWLESAMELGALNYLDVVTIHPYDWTDSGVNEYYRDGLFDDSITELRKLLIRFGKPEMPIIVSEVGQTTAQGYATEVQQAAEAIQIYSMAAANAGIDSVVWYNFCDTYFEGNESIEANWGIVRSNDRATVAYAAKPAYVAMAGFNRLLHNAEYMGSKTFGSVRAFWFRQNGGNDIAVLWSENSDKSVSLRLGAESIEVLDIYTNICDSLSNAEGIYNFTLKNEPIYLCGNFRKLEMVEAEWLDNSDEGQELIYIQNFEDSRMNKTEHFFDFEKGREPISLYNSEIKYPTENGNTYVQLESSNGNCNVGWSIPEIKEKTGTYNISFDFKNTDAWLWLGDCKWDGTGSYAEAIGSIQLLKTNKDSNKLMTAGAELIDLSKIEADKWYNFNMQLDTSSFKKVYVTISDQNGVIATKTKYLGRGGGQDGYPYDRPINKIIMSFDGKAELDNIKITKTYTPTKLSQKNMILYRAGNVQVSDSGAIPTDLERIEIIDGGASDSGWSLADANGNDKIRNVICKDGKTVIYVKSLAPDTKYTLKNPSGDTKTITTVKVKTEIKMEKVTSNAKSVAGLTDITKNALKLEISGQNLSPLGNPCKLGMVSYIDGVIQDIKVFELTVNSESFTKELVIEEPQNADRILFMLFDENLTPLCEAIEIK